MFVFSCVSSVPDLRIKLTEHSFLFEGKNGSFAIRLQFVDPFFLANAWVWQKMVITIGSGVKNYVEIHDPWLKSSTDDPKTAIFHFFDFFLTEPGEGPKP